MNTKKLFQLVSTMFLIFAFQIIPTGVFAKSIQPAQIISVTVSSQNGVSIYGTPGSVTYSVSATGVGISNTGWSVSDLPAGVSGYFTATNTPANDFWNTQLVLVNSDTAPNPGPYTFTVKATNLDNPATFATNTGTYQVEKKKISANLVTENKTYDGTTDAASACIFSGKVGSDDISCTMTSSSFESPNAGPSILVNGSGVVMSGADSGKYILTSTDATGIADITQINQSVILSIATPTNPTSIDAPIPLSSLIVFATSTSGIPPIIQGEGACEIISSNIHFKSSRSNLCFITAYVRNDNLIKGATTTNFRNNQMSTSFLVNKKRQTITQVMATPTSVTFGDVDIDIADLATTDSGLPLTYLAVVSGAGACTIPTGTTLLHFERSGTCSIAVRQAGNIEYYAANGIYITFKVSKKKQTITQVMATPTSVTFGDADIDIVDLATTDSGLPLTYLAVVSGAGACTIPTGTTLLHFERSGTCSIAVRQAGNAAFAAATGIYVRFQVLKKTQTITFILDDISAPITAGQVALNATSTSGLPIIFVTPNPKNCSIVGNVLTPLLKGNCGIYARQAGSSSYLPAAQVTRTLVIK
jgi:hypothetical protein